MSALDTFATYLSDARVAPLSDEVIHHTKRAVIDWYAALLAGAREAPCKLIEVALADDLDRGTACLALGRRATPRAAALINGTAAHTAEVDDIYREAIYHPGAPTIAAALAAGGDVGATGLQFLSGVVAGYEVSTRIGAAMGRAHYRFWHNTGTIGTFGASAAASVLYELDERRAAQALATCATFAAGLQQAFRMDSMSKPLHAGRAAEGGLLAAQLARQGVTGSADVLDGDAGFGQAMGDAPDWGQAVQGLGLDFNVTRMTFKNHACCGHTFAAIDGALELQKLMHVRPEDIATIRVATYRPALEVAGNPAPITAPEARFSIPFVVATALIHGKVRLAAFGADRLADPQIRALMQRVELSIDPELDAIFPNRRAARVTIVTHRGETREFLQPTRKGDPELPLTDEDLNEKFLELGSPVIGEPKARAFLARLWSLEKAASVATLNFDLKPTTL